MKKTYLFGLSAMAAMMMFTSCSEEELVKQPQAGELAQVSINVNTPELGAATRAFGDGKTSQTLHYAVYNVKGEGENRTRTYLNELTVENHKFELSTTVDLQLVTGNTYDVIFWADADTDQSAENNSTPYSINWEKAAVSVNYDNVTCNNENYDAFFNWMTIHVDASKTEEIKLFRPFAQLNIGTSDIVQASQAGYTLQQTQVTVKAYQTLNLWGKIVSDPTDVIFNAADYPNYDANADYGLKNSQDDGYEEFPVKGYEYMAMNYLLCPADKELVDVEFDFFADNGEPKERKYASVPVQRNWRTNIYGQLITSDVDVNVEIVPAFAGAHNIDLAWDGRTITEPSVDNVEKVLTIYSGEQLAWLAASVNGTLPVCATADANTYEGWTIKLAADINLNNQQWTPIGKGEFFEGTFEGNGHKISNLKYSFDGEDYYVGLFGNLKNATVKNLTINNVDINLYGEGTWGHIGAVAGWAEGTSIFDNINITGSVKIEGQMDAEGSHRIGAIVGGNQSGEVSFTNITVDAEENSYVKGQAYVGGIAGQLQGKATFDNCSSNIDVFAYKHFAGGIVGCAPQENKINKCSTSGDISVLAGRAGNANDLFRVGGIAGGWAEAKGSLILADCSYSGTLSGQDANGVVATGFDCDGYVGRGYAATVGASVSVNGVVYTYQGNGTYLVDGVYEVSTIAGLQHILNNDKITGDVPIALIGNLAGNVTIVQKEGVNIVIDGRDHKYNGTFFIHGQARYEGAETLKFKNIKFATAKSGHYFIDSNSTASAERYAHNVTVEDCSFAAEGDAEKSAVAMRIRQGYNIAVAGATVNNMHSLLQAYGCAGVSIDRAQITEGKNGISFGTSTDLTLTNSTIAAGGYGVRADGTTAKLAVSSTEISATQPIIVRKLTKGEYSLAIGENVKLETEETYQIVITNGSDDEPYSAPTGTYTLTGEEGYNVYPVASSAASLQAAIDNEKLSEISLENAVTSVGKGFGVNRDVVFNMNNMEFNAGSDANSKWYALEINGKKVEINDANFTRAGIWAGEGAKVIFNSGVINHKPERTSRYIFCAQSGSTITIKDGTFNNDRQKNAYFWADNATIYVEGGNFGGVASTKKIVLSNGGQVIITGGTFNFDPTAWVADGYKATKSSSTWTVVAESATE